MTVEEPGAWVVCDEVDAARRAAESAHAVGVPPLIVHHVAVPVNAVHVVHIALHRSTYIKHSTLATFTKLRYASIDWGGRL